MLEVRFELNVNKVIEEIADVGNVDTATGWEIIDMNLEELSESKLININEKDEGVPDEVTPTENFTFKELSMYQKLSVNWKLAQS